MPVNFVLGFYPGKKIQQANNLGGKRSIENKLNKI